MNHQAHQAHEGSEADKIRRLEALAREVVDAGLKVHRALGPGLLESTYERCLERELGLRGIGFHRQVPLPILYERIELESGYLLDMVVGDAIILEIKAVEVLTRLHSSQLFDLPEALRL